MVHDAKYSILELDGEEFEVPTEHRALVEEIWEDEDYTRKLHELVYTHPHVILVGKEVIIKAGQQLFVSDGIEIQGQLTIDGSLVVN